LPLPKRARGFIPPAGWRNSPGDATSVSSIAPCVLPQFRQGGAWSWRNWPRRCGAPAAYRCQTAVRDPPLGQGTFPSARGRLANRHRNAIIAVPGCRGWQRRDRGAHLALSPDNRLLAVLRPDGALTLREVSTWKECAALPPANRSFVAFAPDGRRLATNDGGQVQLFDVPTLSPAPGSDKTTGRVLCGCFSADGSRLAVGTEDRTVQLWDLRTGELRELHGHRERVSAVAFAPDGRTLASGGWDRTVRLWNVVAGQEVATLEGHAGKVLALVFSPSGRLLASGGEAPSAGGEVLFWQAD
jgi:hypothetical protein